MFVDAVFEFAPRLLENELNRALLQIGPGFGVTANPCLGSSSPGGVGGRGGSL